MVAGEYAARWDGVMDTLLAAAAQMGVPPERIVRGEFGKQPSMQPPYVLVYVEPETAIPLASGQALRTRYRLLLFAVAQDADQATAITAAWDIAVAAYDALTATPARAGIIEDVPPVRVDYVSGTLCVVVLEMEVYR